MQGFYSIQQRVILSFHLRSVSGAGAVNLNNPRAVSSGRSKSSKGLSYKFDYLAIHINLTIWYQKYKNPQKLLTLGISNDFTEEVALELSFDR